MGSTSLTMTAIKIELNIDQALRRLGTTSVEARRAIPRALNRVAITARARAARAIIDVGYNIKISSVKDVIKINRASGQATAVSLYAKSYPIPLSKFKPTGGGTPHHRLPIRVRVMKGSVTLKHAFFATMASGHVGIFSRYSQKAGTTSKRKPIYQLYGPSVTDMFKNADVQKVTQATVTERFPIEMRRELAHVLDQR